jgi:hypothetical protein
MNKGCESCKYEDVLWSIEPCVRCRHCGPYTPATAYTPKESAQLKSEPNKYAFTQNIIDAIEKGKEVWTAYEMEPNKWQRVEAATIIRLAAMFENRWSLTKPKQLVTKTCERWVSDVCIQRLNVGDDWAAGLHTKDNKGFENKITITYEVEE